ncbi:MAG: hypothetical protein E3J21_16660 [Anaerolineales bacterium]|nr:MAG: hypothetical protein E3J21_16660 [Anaerolineales bacterium]
MIYIVSFVVQGGGHPGAIQNMEKRPDKGDRVKLGDKFYEVVEVVEIVPARGEFGYLHATCRPVEE